MPLDVAPFLANPDRLAAETAARALEPPPKVDLVKWGQENVVFGKESPRPGPYDPDYHAIDRFILEALGPDHPALEVIDIGSAQTGKTVRQQIFIGGSQALDPCPFLVYHPTTDNAESWAKLKWKAFLRGCKKLRALFPGDRSRASGNAVLFQERVDGLGAIEIAGALSPSALSQRSAPRQAQDDLSKWENNAAGDSEQQADSRTAAFKDAVLQWVKVLKSSTPLVMPGCRITKNYLLSTQGEFHLACPHCGVFAPLTWDNFKLGCDAIKDARRTGQAEPPPHFTCLACKGQILEKHLDRMLKSIRIHFKNFEEGARRRKWGFYSWDAYIPGRSWAALVQGWLDAEGDAEKERAFLNDRVGIAQKVQGEAPEWKTLYDRANASGVKLGRIPVGGIILCLGADCQGDRVEWHLKAFGRNGRRWTVEYGVIAGHISEDSAKEALDALLLKAWPDAFGNARRADMLAIDGNYATLDVLDWASKHPENRVVVVRGIRGDAAPVLALVKHLKTAGGETIKTQSRFYNVGTSTLKAALYKALFKVDPIATGYCAYPEGLNEEFFKQLCAERRVPVKVRNGTEWRWERIEGQPNEVLDTEIYAEAAAHRLGWKRLSDADWERLIAEREAPPKEPQLDLLDPSLAKSGPAEPFSFTTDAPQAGPEDRARRSDPAARPAHGVRGTSSRRVIASM